MCKRRSKGGRGRGSDLVGVAARLQGAVLHGETQVGPRRSVLDARIARLVAVLLLLLLLGEARVQRQSIRQQPLGNVQQLLLEHAERRTILGVVRPAVAHHLQKCKQHHCNFYKSSDSSIKKRTIDVLLDVFRM